MKRVIDMIGQANICGITVIPVTIAESIAVTTEPIAVTEVTEPIAVATEPIAVMYQYLSDT